MTLAGYFSAQCAAHLQPRFGRSTSQSTNIRTTHSRSHFRTRGRTVDCDRKTIFFARPRPPSWWKFVSSVSMPEKFLPQLPYTERSQSDQGLGIPLKQPSTASLVLDLSIHRFVAGGSDH